MKQVLLEELEDEEVSHHPDITKRVMVRNGEVPHITGFSQAVLMPGQQVEAHSHESMYEVFLVERGYGCAFVEKETVELSPGRCLVIEPGESHQFENTGTEALVLTYFGVACK